MGVLVLVVGATVAYSHTITAPAPLALPSVAPSTAASSRWFDGVWRVGAGSIVGWRVHQELLGQQSTLVARTGKVAGSLTIDSGSVTEGSFAVDVAALAANPTQRTVFGADAHPTATLALTSPISLGAASEGVQARYPASGALTFNGLTRDVSFTVGAERTANGIAVLADLPIPFSEWHIAVQGIPFLGDLESPATVEVLLDLARGAGNR